MLKNNYDAAALLSQDDLERPNHATHDRRIRRIASKRRDSILSGERRKTRPPKKEI